MNRARPSATGSREPSPDGLGPDGLGPAGFDPARIREVVSDGSGLWRTCTGCYETSDGYNVNGHPHSEVFGCILGSGCQECGGLGVVWDSTDYEDWAHWMLDQEQRTAATTRRPNGGSQ